MDIKVGKSGGFVVTGSRLELYRVATISEARFYQKDLVVKVPANINTVKSLEGFPNVRIAQRAKKLMRDIKAEYKQHRRALRAAEARYKKAKGRITLPVPLKLIPYQHQVRAFGFCTGINHPALFMDQGTGKTMVAIATAGWRFLEGQVKRVVVVCPKNVKPVWAAEFKKHADFPHTVSMNIPDRVTDGLEVVVVNYEALRLHVKEYIKWKADMVILDESHYIKNRKSRQTSAAISLGKRVSYRMLLSGTPFGKCISEVWSQFKFLNQDVFGASFSTFKNRYLQMGGYMQYQVVGYNNIEEFDRKMHENAFRVTKEDCIDLPETQYIRVPVAGDGKTKDFYKKLERELYVEQNGEEATASSAAVLAMKLRQVAGGALLSDEKTVMHVSQRKLGALEEILVSREGRKTIVFFSFRHEIELAKQLAKKLKKKYLTLTGDTLPSDRDKFTDRFQDDPSYELAFINTACGAEGLTLTAADAAIFYSPSFSFIKYSQCRDRIRRIGQDKQTQIIFIIMEETVDNHVVDVLECNGQLVDKHLNNNRNYNLEDMKMPKAQETKYNVASIAEETGLNPADVRKYLRASELDKPEGGWKWTKKTEFDKVVKAVKALAKSSTPKAKADTTKPGKGKGKKTEGKVETKADTTKPGKKGKKAESADSEVNLEEMDKKALLAYAGENEIEVPKAKQRSLKMLRSFIADAQAKK